MKKLILGTVQMGIDYGINNSLGKITLENSHEILLEASKAGISIIDTAEAYGNAHKVIGEFHKKYNDINFKVITKIPHHFLTKDLKNKIKNYISILEVRNIEILMFHSFESYLKNKESIHILNELKLEGIIKNIGVSVYTNRQIEQLINDEFITVVQLPFNLLDNFSIRGDLIKQLKSHNKFVHTRSAFLQGLFFKKYDRDNKIMNNLKNELMELNKIKEKANCTMEELALSYCINQPYIDNVIIGVDSLQHLKSNIMGSKFLLRESEIKHINSIKVRDLDLLNPSLWNT